jgi:hypothetical protein
MPMLQYDKTASGYFETVVFLDFKHVIHMVVLVARTRELRQQLQPVLVGLATKLAPMDKVPTNARSSGQLPATPLLGKYLGTFDSQYHSDGSVEFTLNADGTMTGSWVTENKTFSLDVKGIYKAKGPTVTMVARGTVLLRSTIKARAIIAAVGKASTDKLIGTFTISIDNPQFPDDTGTWKAARASR